MNSVRQFGRRLLSLMRRRRFEREMEEEMHFHLEMQIEQNKESGMATEEARRAAQRQFGNQTWLKEVSREMWSMRSFETLVQDLRFGVRIFIKNPGFTLIAVFTLALGIGANTAIFSVVYAVLLRPLPYQSPEQLVVIWARLPQAVSGNVGASAGEFADYRDQNKVFSSVAAFTSESFNLTGAGEPERIIGTLTSASLFTLLNVQPALGRAFLDEEDKPGRDRVVILSNGLWQRRFAGNSAVLGQAIMLNGQSHTIVGVMPPDFQFSGGATDLWKPIAFTAEQVSVNERGSHYLNVIARMKDGVTLEEASADVAAIAERMQQHYPTIYRTDSGWGGWGASAYSLYEETVGDVRLALLVLFGAVGCVLLIGCANVANLLLTRASSRRREIAVRVALGAGRLRIIRQLLTESTLLSVIGGSLGVLLAVGTLGILSELIYPTLPRMVEVGIDSGVLGFTALVTLLTGILFGLAPGWQSAKLDLNKSLKEGGNRSTEGRGRHQLHSLLVVGEIAISLVLLAGAGLMIKSLYLFGRVDPGFDPANVLTFRMALPEAKYPDPQRSRAFFEQLLGRIVMLPGVKAAGAINFLPLSGTGNQRSFLIEGKPEPKLNVGFRMVSPDYFHTMQIPLRAGRFPDARDLGNSTSITLVNETFARIFLPDEDPIGKKIKIGSEKGPFPWMTIVGVVGDVRHKGPIEETGPEMYTYYLHPLLPHWNMPPMFLVVRSEINPSSLIAAVRGAVRELDQDQPVYSIRTMEQLLSRSVAPQRINMTLLSVFAALALVLAAIGIYGVMAYAVTERTHEIGIRMALGAERHNVLWMIVRRGMTLALIGMAAGLTAALALTRVMKDMLFNVSPTDTETLAGIVFLLVAVTFIACFIPARKATKVDPLEALRVE
jgi:predicted permease